MHSETRRLAEKFSDAADIVADENSFVAMRKLVEFFDAEFRAQPLLYEGLVAEPREANSKWVIMVNSHESGFSHIRYEKETSEEALPPRLRFTIAHELSHVVQLKENNGTAQSANQKRASASVRQDGLEREADALSPLLLISTRALERLFGDRKNAVDLAELIEARRRWAVSREVLVHRLGLLSKFDPQGFRFRPALRNIAVGVVERNTNGDIAIGWPNPVCNFEENLVPEFLQRESATKQSLSEFFTAPEFCINVGARDWDEADVYFGTSTNPRTEKARVHITLERLASTKRARALFVARRI